MDDGQILISKEEKCSFCGEPLLYGHYRFYHEGKGTHLFCYIEYMAQLKAQKSMDEHLNKYHKGETR